MIVRKPSCLLRRTRYSLACARSHLINLRDRWFDATASSFFDALSAGGFRPNAHIDVLPQHALIYVGVPKCASTTIKAVLSALNGRSVVSHVKLHNRRHTGLLPPQQVGVSAFYRLATSPATLRFSFVRNPYARLVSAWADKFQNKPLVPGDSFVDQYLAYRRSVGSNYPIGPDRALAFPEFVDFATTTAEQRVNAHWHVQDDLLNMPGIHLDLVGKVESFADDFDSVLDHVGADQRLRAIVARQQNKSRHQPWPEYYSDALAGRVYRGYERDFDRFGYARATQRAAVG